MRNSEVEEFGQSQCYANTHSAEPAPQFSCRTSHNCDLKRRLHGTPIEESKLGVSSMVRCIACGAEMKVARVEQDEAMKSAGL
jgi:hypothetical protein